MSLLELLPAFWLNQEMQRPKEKGSTGRSRRKINDSLQSVSSWKMKEYERLRSQANVLIEQLLPHNDSWTKVKVFLDNFKQLLLTLLGCAIVEDGNGKRMGHSDGIRNLHHCECNFIHEWTSNSKDYTFWAKRKVSVQLTCTRTRLHSLAFTRDLATQRAAYAAERSTLV